MATPLTYSVADVLAVAKIHPFYRPEIKYPPDARTVCLVKKRARKQAAKGRSVADLQRQPLLRKRDLYQTIERLVNDTSPQNSYRHSIYASITGGGFGAKPLFFATDVHENRRQRAHFGQFLRATGLITPGDWVLTTHATGELYRSLDLTLETMENAGASVLAAGNHMAPADVIRLLIDYHVNVLSGDSSQVVQLARHISTLSQDQRRRVKIDKIIYTSETLTTAQRACITTALGSVKICSILGSAEAGPHAVSSPDLTDRDPRADAGYEDFVFDTRLTLFEILPPSFAEHGSNPEAMTDGVQGIVAQTSLTRLRNPVVRYITGDVGSLQPVPEKARRLVPESLWPHLRVLRLNGRDRRFSFEWDGEYIEFHGLALLLDNAETGVLQWQAILDKLEPSLETTLEIRLLCSPRNAHLVSEEVLVGRVRNFFHAYAGNEYRFKLAFVGRLDEFELSRTGRKVVKFVDRVG